MSTNSAPYALSSRRRSWLIVSGKSAGDVIKVKVYRVEGLDDLLNDENATLDDIPEGQYVDMEITLAVVDNVKQ